MSMPPKPSFGERLGNFAHRATVTTLILITTVGMVYVGGCGVEIFHKWRDYKVEKALKAQAVRKALEAQAEG